MGSKGEKGQLRRLLVSAVAAVLLLLLYGVIFRFSAQDAEVSGSLSQRISVRLVEFFNSLFRSGWSEATMAGMAERFDHPVRKLAHFSEYACMGVLVYTLWSQWLRAGRRLYLLTVVWVFVSAACDEFHQCFVPGRDGNLPDVLLDTSGGACGMLFCICAAALYRRHVRRKG